MIRKSSIRRSRRCDRRLSAPPPPATRVGLSPLHGTRRFKAALAGEGSEFGSSLPSLNREATAEQASLQNSAATPVELRYPLLPYGHLPSLNGANHVIFSLPPACCLSTNWHVASTYLSPRLSLTMATTTTPNSYHSDIYFNPQMQRLPQGDFMTPSRKTNGIGVQAEDMRICVVMVGLPARGKSLIAGKGMSR